MFGQIAAANSLSDIYAMGATPMYAQSVLCFPKDADEKTLELMLKGSSEKLLEAGAVLTGGHSIYDKSAKLGFCVTSISKSFWRNNTPQAGDKIILTKRLGTGILSKVEEDLKPETKNSFHESMATLNKYAFEVMKNYSITSCTDVTGFGLLGHLLEMIKNTGYGAILNTQNILFFDEVLEFAQKTTTASSNFNREYLADYITNNDVDNNILEVLYDAQTSGGLLFTISSEEADKLCDELKENGVEAAQIGQVTENKNKIEVI